MTTTNAPTRKIPRTTLFLYGAPTVGLGYLLFFLQFYFLKFATDDLLLAPAAVRSYTGVLFCGNGIVENLRR